MSVPRRDPLPSHRPPTSPGEMLLEEHLKPAGLSQTALAERMGVTVQTINAIINGRRAITAEMAIKLGKALQTAPQFWMNLQTNYDLWHAERKLAKHG
jgi:addiction module HigA family antidote